MWDKTKNLVNIDAGNYRSILGYAGESLAIGRALVCGYNLFFKAWRDAKYDAVLDASGTLFRIEIKQTSGTHLSVTSGGRSGKQIDKTADSREEVLSTKDCDFVIGTHSMSAKCWIIPVEVISIARKKSLHPRFLENFEEKWEIFKYQDKNISVSDIKNGFEQKNERDIDNICTKLGIENIQETKIPFSTRTFVDNISDKEKKVLLIWMKIFEELT